MKYILLFFILLSQTLNFSAVFADAASCDTNATDIVGFIKDCQQGTTGGIPDNGGMGIDGLKAKATAIGKTAIGLGGLFAIGALVWGGIQYNSSFGDDEKVKHAKNTIIYAIIGLLLMMISYPFVNIVIDFVYEISRAN